MSYTVRFTETNNPTKTAKIVEDQTLNTETSLTFVGKNYAGYAAYVAENFLHLLENFANSTEPLNPVEGQLWFNNSPGVSQLQVWDGSAWTETGGVKKSTAAPVYKTLGDLWVDTENQQLKVWTGSSWILVGPQYSAGSKTGFEVETIIDLLDVPYSVLTCYVANERIAIFSKSAFTPKGTVTGFSGIKQGVTLSSASAYKFWGTADKANSLVVNGIDVASTNFLRSDQTSTTNYNLYVKNDGGITVGSDLRLSLQVDGNAGVIYNSVSGSYIDINVNNAGNTATVIRVDSTKTVGINKTNPTESLDVSGNIATDAAISITGTQDATNLTTASLVTLGGASINKKLIVGSDATINGTININPTSSSAMLPSTTEAYDLGSAAKKFNNVYAKTFVGNFTGSFTGSLGSGTTSQFARQLLDATSFYIAGDVVTTSPLVFNGVTQNQTATFNTVISETFVTRQTEILNSTNTDQLLVFRPGTGIRKTTKETFFSSVATIPIGGILPYAGSVVPNGFLLCDGSEVPRSTYGQLFSKIGYTYRDITFLKGYLTFALPDLRGRFPLGRDNMENTDRNTNLPLQVKTKASGEAEANGTGTAVYTDAGGGVANNVTSVAGSTLGVGAGAESVTLSVSNLPDHRHNMRGRKPDGTVGQQYYGYRNATGTPTDVDARLDLGTTAANSAHYLPHSGNVDATLLGQPVASMNPFLTINYIIYTGVLV
jgi:microcystin-dependent protein